MNVLVINCGSSSLKFQLINAESEEVLAKGICERIGIDGRLTYQPEGGEKEVSEKAMPTHTEAIQFVIEALTNPETGVVKSLDEIGAVGHRVVHGGEKFASSVVATTMVMSTINAPLAIYASDNSAQESAEKIEFKTAGEDSIYKGLPLFDGIPAHLDAYLDVLMDYIGTEGMVRKERRRTDSGLCRRTGLLPGRGQGSHRDETW